MPIRPPQRRVPLVALLLALALLGGACNLRAVGANFRGQLGDGTEIDRATPVTASVVTFAKVSSGDTHSCGIDAAGALYCWGDGASSRLGLGDTTSRTEPTRVGTASDWTAVSAGAGHTCGIRATVVQCWGTNFHGQVIPGGERPISTPTTVYTATGDPATAVSAGSSHTCAVHASGRLHCWGRNDDGQLGTGDTLPRDTVELVGTGYRAVSVDSHSCAITTGGEMHCWGRGIQGQLGNGDLDRRLEPTRVAHQPGWTAVDVGSRHTCARAADRTAWCWGEGARGKLGTGSEQLRPVPAPVAPSARWIALSAGGGHTCGVRADNRVFCWGDNARGQLGDGTTTARLVPTAMTGDLVAIDVSAGRDHTHVLLAPEE